MSFLHLLTEKPWASTPGGRADTHDGSAFAVPAATIGLRVFLGVVTVLFSLLIVAYGTRMEFEDWRPGPDLRLLWLNTAMLVLSSMAMQWAHVGAGRGEIDNVRIGLIAGGAFAVAFVVGQTVAWRQLNMMVVFDITSPAIAFFYLITGLHAVHLLGGLVAWGRTFDKIWRQGFEVAEIRLSVQLCAHYWHFLLLVWLVLFGLLFSGNDNLGFLLAICGIR